MKIATTAAAAFAAILLAGAAPAREAKTINVLTTTTDLAALAREVGGDAVKVSSLMKGPEDPHFLDARPSFSRMARDADLFVKVGMELEIGYEKPIVLDARNPRIQPGTPGFLDASSAVDKLEVPTGVVDRSLGDVHGEGNPHYLLDPVRGKAVAAAIAGSLAKVDPDRADAYRERAKAFARRVDESLFGARLLEKAPAKRLERLLSEGTLSAYLKEKGWEGELGGWAKAMAPLSGAKVASYHGLFAYFLERFHVENVAYLEPKPGIPPGARHVRGVVDAMKRGGVRALLVASYHPKDVAEAAARDAGARLLTLAHMPGAIPGAEDYFAVVDANVKALAAALAGT